MDLGCGHQILPPWRAQSEAKLVKTAGAVVGIDYDLDSLNRHASISLKARADIERLPFANDSFDLATANMVVEHLEDPDAQFREIWRVLRPGGSFLFHTPNAFSYTTVLARMIPDAPKSRLANLLDGRPGGDVWKTYYRVNSERKIRWLASTTGFDVSEVRFIASSAELAVIPPLAALELVWLRMLMTKTLRRFRPNIIVLLRKRLG